MTLFISKKSAEQLVVVVLACSKQHCTIVTEEAMNGSSWVTLSIILMLVSINRG